MLCVLEGERWDFSGQFVLVLGLGLTRAKVLVSLRSRRRRDFREREMRDEMRVFRG